jgi:hypothetical protein
MHSLEGNVKDALHHIHKNGVNPENQTILITGGSGFVAAHVLNAFLSRGYKVRATG